MARGYPDFEGGKSKLFTVADWAAVEATDKDFNAYAANKAWSNDVTLTYLVPAGKRLYITEFAFAVGSFAEANADNNQMALANLYIAATATYKATLGGNGGAAQTFNKPKVFDAGETMTIEVISFANHAVNLSVTAHGYEV